MSTSSTDQKVEIMIDVNRVGTKRKQQALSTKTRIFESAIELIKEKGYSNVSVSEICEKSKVTKGAFYHHFDSKESIIKLMYVDTDSYLLKKLPQILKNPSALERIKEILLALADRSEYRGVEIMKQFIKQNLDNPGVINLFDATVRPMGDIHISVIEDGQLNGEIRKDMTPEYIFWYINTAYNGFLLNWCIQNGSYGFKDMIQKVIPPILSNFKSSS